MQFKETSICDVSNAQHIANGASKDQYSNLTFFMLETHTTVTYLARCKVEFTLTAFITSIDIFVTSAVGGSGFFCCFFFFSNLGGEEPLFSMMQKSNLNFFSAGSHVIHLIFLSGFIMK